MKIMRHIPGIRAILQLTIWLWEPMTFTDPFANRVRPGLLSRTSTPNKPQRRLYIPPRPAAPRPSPYRALVLTD
jgi:hypothetical protein